MLRRRLPQSGMGSEASHLFDQHAPIFLMVSAHSFRSRLRRQRVVHSGTCAVLVYDPPEAPEYQKAKMASGKKAADKKEPGLFSIVAPRGLLRTTDVHIFGR